MVSWLYPKRGYDKGSDPDDVAEQFLPIDPRAAEWLLIDEASPSLLRWRLDRGNHVKAGSVAGTQRPDGRWRVGVCGRLYYTYRVYVYLSTGRDLVDAVVDHKNGDSSHHAPVNLRVATRSQNNANRRPRSGYKGVSLHAVTGLWRARINVNGKEKTTYHPTAEAAARAYDELATQAHGEFAFLNFPEVNHVHSS
jgi:hypothetical protein